MAKAQRYYYECVLTTDLAYYGPDQRRERFVRSGRSEIPQPTMHCVRVLPSRGVNARGEEIPADYIVTEQPLGKNYTEEVVKKVSRPDFEHPGRHARQMREKVSKVKFVLRDPGEIPEAARRSAYNYGPPIFATNEKGEQVQVSGWHAAMFETHDKDVRLPLESMRMAASGRAELVGDRKGA